VWDLLAILVQYGIYDGHDEDGCGIYFECIGWAMIRCSCRDL
jgi:hypothetical protein